MLPAALLMLNLVSDLKNKHSSHDADVTLMPKPEMGKTFNKFRLLMWKNFLMQWRNPRQTLIEIFSPVVFCSLLVFVRSLVDPESHSQMWYTPFKIKMPILRNFSSFKEIAWSPKNPLLEKIMGDAVDAISRDEGVRMKHVPFGDEDEVEKYLSRDDKNVVLAGVVFDEDLDEATALPSHMNVTIRFPAELRKAAVNPGADEFDYTWKTDRLFAVYQVAGPRGWDMNDGAEPGYHYEGYLKLQQEISYSIINHFKLMVHKTALNRAASTLYMQRYPYPKWIYDKLMIVLRKFAGLIIILSFVYTCISTVKVITTEKEKQIKETMKIMGLPNWLHWTAWFIKSFLVLFVTTMLIVFLMKVPWYPGTEVAIFTHSDSSVIFFFLMLFACSSITFCFAVSVFFSKASTAATFAGMAWFLSYIPYSFLVERYSSTTLLEKIFSSLFSNSAMCFGLQLMIMFEGIGEGLQWHNIWKSTTPDDTLKLGHLIIMLIVDAILYLLIALYMEAVYPGDYGIPRPWNFLFTKSFWFENAHHDMHEDIFTEERITNDLFEKEPQLQSPAISILHLGKTYPDGKVALKDLSLNMYEDQITVLLGHNGAGKTTTMFMLTGMIPPSVGTAVINGWDIRTNIAEVRENLGLCPQHNILFDELTVREHLRFFAQLKGLSKADAIAETEKYVELLGLIPKADAQSHTLSGGMKRKLSAGIALCGGSSVVIFDEPTAGVDPAARRSLWDLLLAQKEGRTIILTTHFMDEADLLGDRIAILAEGTLQCCGTSFFLKKKYGAGYHLVMDKSPKCDVTQITKLLQKHIPNLQVKSDIGSELTYLISEKHSAVFEAMLRELESNSAQLGILTYGISLTTLEEVFMKVRADVTQEETRRTNVVEELRPSNGGQQDHENENPNKPFMQGWPLWINQFLSMMMKRRLSLLRSRLLLVLHALIPVVIISLSILVVTKENFNKSHQLPKLEMRLGVYRKPRTVVTHYAPGGYTKRYIEAVEAQGEEIINWGTADLGRTIFEVTKRRLTEVRLKYIAGATFYQNKSIVAWFNNEPLHSPPLSLQLVLNAILHEEVSPRYHIQFYNHPLPFASRTQFMQAAAGQVMAFQISFNTGFSMVFVSAYYIIFYVKERASGAKHLQFVSGAEVMAFWLPAFIWDAMTHISISLGLIITLLVFQEEGFRTAEELGRVFLLLLFVGFCVLPMTYLASYFFDIPSTGYIRMALFNIFTGIAGFLTVEILNIPEMEKKHISKILHWVFLPVPIYSLITGLKNLNVIRMLQQICDVVYNKCIEAQLPPNFCQAYLCKEYADCCKDRYHYGWNTPGIGRNLIFTGTLGVVLIIVLLVIEYGVVDKIRYGVMEVYCPRPSPPPPSGMEDSDVKEEKENIRSATKDQINSYILVMRDLTKYYGKFLAVNSVCLGINTNQCFGLLGANGAGKTTTFKMMTGDVKCSSGNAWVKGLNLKYHTKEINRLIGYCPQFDALLDELTCRETLLIFCLLRGIPEDDSKFVAIKLAHDFDFFKHIDKKVGKLSGGNKRKLSTALAMVGDPLILYLDEPTTGMDPSTKRFLWNELCKVRDRGKCIILTSHSMEECEALCTQLAIMVNGSFVCLGSTQHLKSKFSGGYTLTIKVRKTATSKLILHSEMDSVEAYVMENFPKAVVREQYQELVTFYIADRTLQWSRMFGIMEKGKKSLNIEDYSLGQSSLEQVFLSFTKYQRED